MAKLRQGLSTRDYQRIVQAKLIDWISKNQPSADDMLRIRRIVRQLLGDELDPWVQKVFKKYEDILEAVNRHYSDLGVDVTRDFPTIRAIEEVNALSIGEYEDAVAEAIAQAVRESIMQGESVRELEDRIKELGDRAEVYARTLAQTQLHSVARVAKHEKAAIAEVQYFEYVGIIRMTTRPFCAAHVGRTMHLDTIHLLRNGNKSPVLAHCGGWNCIHDLEPDPFATAESDGELVDMTDRITIHADEAAIEEYHAAEQHNKEARRKSS